VFELAERKVQNAVRGQRSGQMRKVPRGRGSRLHLSLDGTLQRPSI